MLVIKVELWPFGNEAAKTTIAAARIANRGKVATDPTGKGYKYSVAYDDYRDGELVDTILVDVDSHDRTKHLSLLLTKAFCTVWNKVM